MDTLCASLTAEGNPVTCTPVEGYPLSVQASWEPRQEGEGDPSPENVRPITGLDEVTVQRSGKNLMPYTKPSQSSYTSNGVTFTWNDDGSMHVSGTAVGRADSNVMNFDGFYLPPGKYRMISPIQSGVTPQFVAKKGSTGTNIWFNPTNILIENGDVPQYFYVSINDGVAVDTTVYAFLSYGIENPTDDDYAPYTGTTATLTLPETIYGGTVDAVTGEGSQEWAHIDSYNGEALPGEWISDRDVYAPDTTPTIGAEIAYKLATPTPFQATGNQPLPALPGTNTVYTDADAVRVEGRTDPLATVQTLTARIAALEAAAEQQAQANAALATLGVDTTPDQITALRMLGVETEE